MSEVQPDEQEDKPLDPAVEAVRRKMIRLQVVSGGVMFVSLMAVFGAVVYKAMPRSTADTVRVSSGFEIPADAPLAATAALPEGFSVENVSLSGSQILFFGTAGNGQKKAFVFDLGVGRIVADVTVGGS